MLGTRDDVAIGSSREVEMRPWLMWCAQGSAFSTRLSQVGLTTRRSERLSFPNGSPDVCVHGVVAVDLQFSNSVQPRRPAAFRDLDKTMCSAQGLSTGGWCGALPWLTHAIHVIFEIYIHFPGGSKGNLQGWAHLAHSLRGCCPHKHLRLAPCLKVLHEKSRTFAEQGF